MITPCTPATGKPNNQGYVYQTIKGRTNGAHVFAFEAAYGPVPATYEVHHKCLNRSCVNPEHLEALTPTEHYRRHASPDNPISKCYSIPGDLAAAVLAIAKAEDRTQSAIVTEALTEYARKHHPELLEVKP